MRSLIVLTCCLAAQIAIAQTKPVLREKVQPPADKDQFWIFLLAGQSNMAGRGTVEPTDTLPNARVLTLNKDGEWEIAKDPIHFDRSYTGVGPGFSFGKHMADDNKKTVYIGLIPCAVGGSSINSWKPATPGGSRVNNYTKALERCQKVIGSGTLKGIVWNQGETDCTERGAPGYEDKLVNLVTAFRKDLGNENLVFISALLPEFQKQQPDSNHQLQLNPYVDKINEGIANAKNRLGNYDYIMSEKTDHKGDHLHYNTVSARLIGARYATLMQKMLKGK